MSHFAGIHGIGLTCKHLHEAPHETESTSPEPSEEIEEKAIPFPLIGSGQSRLQSEFNYIGPIGKGGFGEVMKVQKLLDGRVYAIKRIQLNPRNPKLTKKIVREVKLLSRLDHENVVRYYNSWVEVMETTSAAASKAESTSTDEDDEVKEVEVDPLADPLGGVSPPRASVGGVSPPRDEDGPTSNHLGAVILG